MSTCYQYTNMSFNTFCNVCFMKENIIKLCVEESESILNVLISFTSCSDAVTGIIYLCINCCNKLEECNKFRELFLMNFVRFRYLYNEHKKQLEIHNTPDIEKQLKTFVDINVQRPSGTPLIENYEVQALTNDTCNVDITLKDGEFFKRDLDKLVITNDLHHAGTLATLEKNISENEIETYFVKCENDVFNEDLENIHGSSIGRNEPNVDRCKESHDPLVSDTVAKVIPYHESADVDVPDVFSNLEDCATDDNTDEEGEAAASDIVCNVCDECFTCNSDLEVHIRTHTGEKYDCDKCNKKFTDVSKLKRHNRVHTGKRPYKCEECDLRFTQLSHLSAHKLTHTGEKPYKCDECDLKFTQRSTLNTHKRTHSGVKPYKCDECGLGFAQRSNLNRHKLKHTGERPFSCDECRKTFTQIANLKKHKRTHTGEKSYKCDECGMGFAQLFNLNRHKRTHTEEKLYLGDECDEKSYVCDVCGLGFRELFHLKSHKLVHTGMKPYKCDECGTGFTKSGDLNRHKRTHTEEKPYSCDECKKKFTYCFNLMKHKRIHISDKE